MPVVRMTSNQRQVFLYLNDNCNYQRIVKCSNRQLAEKFGWSEGYARRLLARMEEHEFLECVLVGTGKRPNKYRLAKILRHHIKVKVRRTKTTSVDEKFDQEDNPNQTVDGGWLGGNPSKLFGTFKVNKNTNVYDTKENVFNISARIRREKNSKIVNDFSYVKLTLTKPKQTPFKKFAEKHNRPESWNALDIVCYWYKCFSFLYGNDTVIDWKKDTGGARNLLKQFDNNPKVVKHYIQVAFLLFGEKYCIHSTTWLTQKWVRAAVAKNYKSLKEDAVVYLRDSKVLAS